MLIEPELEFLKSLWGLGTEEEEGYSTGPPGYIGWRNSFLGIDSGAPYTFKNTGSGRFITDRINSTFLIIVLLFPSTICIKQNCFNKFPNLKKN